MKVVIDIPDEWKERIECNRRPNTIECGELVESIWKGKILPKGHGRLIDADELKTLSYEVLIDNDNPNRADGLSAFNGVVEDDIDYAPTIIEADKE